MNSFAIAAFCGIALAVCLCAPQTTNFQCEPKCPKNKTEPVLKCRYACSNDWTLPPPLGKFYDGTMCTNNDTGSPLEGRCINGSCILNYTGYKNSLLPALCEDKTENAVVS
uniref:Putative secreted protein n=1 Tax=Amblyomma americanum TaxID=6943 RepID=A0A0C9SD51_AMBAM